MVAYGPKMRVDYRCLKGTLWKKRSVIIACFYLLLSVYFFLGFFNCLVQLIGIRIKNIITFMVAMISNTIRHPRHMASSFCYLSHLLFIQMQCYNTDMQCDAGAEALPSLEPAVAFVLEFLQGYGGAFGQMGLLCVFFCVFMLKISYCRGSVPL